MRLGYGRQLCPVKCTPILPAGRTETDIRHKTLCCLCIFVHEFVLFFWWRSVVPAVDFTSSRGSSVNTVTWQWVGRWMNPGSIPGRCQAFCFYPNRPDLLWGPSSPLI